ncbi:pyruvate, water dikinase regulatory protein [Paenibacillus radicis (ex Gao et al. 2016)]|uniref:Putative pyruvate, phosphate dikinase regulatory protein n=1 Tax=Paenibacillus radicis (ex Gao et al. 2016) TaxID=1737354 RepID=A0A917M495_9BACL|nr:pyruvate, water dikinase regulatory protein [Paenibacillus radicis (ex Gao et al. 2016)]GGG76360.1 phosphoenolpyruvate synthase regulatory protein [Paenibacillus radicis (ex Gao et al. 2016)]
MNEMIIYVCSDAVGETGEAVAKATLRQFASEEVKIKRYGHMKSEDEVIQVVSEAASTGGFISYTLVQPKLRALMKEEAFRWGVRAVDVMGPMLEAYVDTFGSSPNRKPGLLHSIDEDYHRRIEAIEFAVKYDDGKDARGFMQAEVVLIGVSRTSKTPLSVFLSHKGIKTANLPLMPEVTLPAELAAAPGRLIIGLTMQPEHLLSIRTERLKTLGLPPTAPYASEARIVEELRYAEKIMESFQCPVIDVTNRAIEETAGLIIEMLYRQTEIRNDWY